MSDKLKLTDRQREVLELVVKAWSRKMIAESLYLSLRTVHRAMGQARAANGSITLERMCYRLGLEEGHIPVANSVTGMGGGAWKEGDA